MMRRLASPLLVVAALAACLAGAGRIVFTAPRAAFAQTAGADGKAVDTATGGAPAPDTAPKAATPAAPPHPAESVALGFYIYDIHDVDIRAGTFGADFYFWMRHAKEKDPERAKEIEKIEFTNGKTEQFDEQDRKEVDGQTYVCWKVEGTFRFIPMLRNYPFDAQRLEITVEHPTLEIDEVVYDDDHGSYERSGVARERWGLKDSVYVPEYEILGVERRASANTYATDFGDPTRPESESVYSRFVVTVRIGRLFGPYFYKIVVPLLVILGMAYLVFFIPPQEIQSASGLAITALLSCIAFDVTVAQNLPAVGYLVVSDKFFITTYFLLFLNLTQSVITYNFYERDRLALAEKWDKVCRIVFPVLYALSFAYLLIAALMARG
jgi:hypothetical protein